MFCMFCYCRKLEYLDLSNFNTSNVVNMEYMFSECNKLNEIKGINQFNTNKVETIEGMFGECHKLKNLDLSNFYTEKVKRMDYMFCNCNNLKYLNLLNFSVINCNPKGMLLFNHKECSFITNSNTLLNIYNSSQQ